MNRFAQMMSFGVVVFSTIGFLQADDPKVEEKKVSKVEHKIKDGPKADVMVRNAKTATAKAGQIVEIPIGMPLSPPFPSDFEVKVDDKKVESKVYVGDVFFDGKPVPGTTVKLIHIKAEGEGKQKVIVHYKQGDQRSRRELELEVTK